MHWHRASFIPSIGLLGLLALGCGPQTGGDSGDSDTTDTPTTTPDPTQTTTSADTGPLPDSGGTTTMPMSGTSTGEDPGSTSNPPLFDFGGIPDAPTMPPPPLPEFDCAAVADQYMDFQVIPGARGYHGLAITPDGLAIGSDGSSLIESTYDGMWSVFIPGIGAGQQMDWLPDGDLAHATSDGAITRIALDGTTQVIQPAVNAYGVIVGPDDLIYATSNFGGDAIYRIDPIAGGQNVWLPSNGSNLHSFNFSPDYSRMYVGTIGNGTLYYVDIDASMNPVGGLQVLATGVGQGHGWHDAVEVDLCGYIYVPDYYSRNLYRISPSGDVVLYWDPANQGHYAHGLTWGTGEHGWREDALYFPQPYNSNNVGEVVVGTPPANWPAIPINPPPPL